MNAPLSASDLALAERTLLEACVCAVVAGNPIPETAALSEDEQEHLTEHLVSLWQILPSVSEAQLTRLAACLKPHQTRRLKQARLAMIAFAKAQVAAARPFLTALADASLRAVALKGTATARTLYEQPFHRTGWDLDVGVARGDLARAEAIALQCGYHAAQQDAQTGDFHLADPQLKAHVEAEHYELGFLVRRLRIANLQADALEAIRAEPTLRGHWFKGDGAPYCYASIDIHHALSHDIPLSGVLEAAQPRQGTVMQPTDAWLAAHLIFKIYWEGVHSYRKGLYQYADLVRLARRLSPLEFERLCAILEQYRLSCAGYYVLRRLPTFGVALSPEMTAFLLRHAEPDAGTAPTPLNDLGDMWPKLWGRR